LSRDSTVLPAHQNISIWELVNHGALRLFAVLRLRNTLTYLLSYTLCFIHKQNELYLGIPAFAFPAAAGTHLPTPEGWKAE